MKVKGGGQDGAADKQEQEHISHPASSYSNLIEATFLQQPRTVTQSPLEEGRRSEALPQQRPLTTSSKSSIFPVSWYLAPVLPRNQHKRGSALGLIRRSFSPRKAACRARVKTAQANGQQPKGDLPVLGNYSQHECFPLALRFRHNSSEHVCFSFFAAPPVPPAAVTKHS